MNAPCVFCGASYEFFVTEVYLVERTFTMGACCEGAYEDASTWLAETDPAWAVSRESFVAWFARETGIRVRALWADIDGMHYDNGGLTLDWGLQLRPVTQAVAKAFVDEHHRHNPAKPGWRWGHGVYNGDELVGVAMVGTPSGRWKNPSKLVEVNRVCVASKVAKLGWNACSMLYGAAAREAKRRGFARILTYIRADESGVTLHAAGWKRMQFCKGRQRVDPRPGRQKGERIDRWRWERQLQKSA